MYIAQCKKNTKYLKLDKYIFWSTLVDGFICLKYKKNVFIQQTNKQILSSSAVINVDMAKFTPDNTTQHFDLLTKTETEKY